ncbi:MAG: TolC family protein [Elusimicrobia bacterium]|nr:TolC family protein [Elusimicrobiota bacterium]
MKRFPPIFSFSFAMALSLRAGLCSAEPSGGPITLNKSYALALDQSETIRNLREDITRSQARARASLGGAFPQVRWNWGDTWQDGSGTGGNNFGGFLEKNQVESKFTLEQTLFSGLKEFSAWSGFQKQEARDRWTLRYAELQLFDRVAGAFYDVVGLEAALENSETSVALAGDRTKELKSFLRLGKSREGEVFSAESQLAALNAIRVRLRGQIRVARENLSFLVGQEIGSIPLEDSLDGTTSETLPAFLSQAEKRPDLEAQRQEVLAQHLRVRYEKGSFWPTAGLRGNYYTQRPAFFEPIDWDLLLSLSVPLYQGGTVSARVKEAKSGLEQAQQTLGHMERQVRTDVKKSFESWTASREEAQALEEAYGASQKSYEAQRREYRLGLVTNLDVLNAMNLMQAAKRAWIDARVEVKRRYVALIISTGALP